MTSKSSIVALGAMALIVLAGPALAQSIDLSPVQTLLQGIVDAITGPLGIVIGTLALIGVFPSWLFGILDFRQALWVVVAIAGIAAAPIGRYRSDVALAQSRVMVAWDRIILPDNQTVEISAFGGDELGRTGTTGFVDTRFAQRFGSAALISLIGALPAAAAGQIEDEAAADIASDVGTDLRDSTQSVMQDYLAIRPVIHVDQGTRITVMVDRDLEIF